MDRPSRLFVGYRVLGFVSNGVPSCVRHDEKRRENFVVTCVGKAFHTYNVSFRSQDYVCQFCRLIASLCHCCRHMTVYVGLKRSGTDSNSCTFCRIILRMCLGFRNLTWNLHAVVALDMESADLSVSICNLRQLIVLQ